MIPTPNLSHLSRDDYQAVYEPAEDTFILLDALEQDLEWFQRAKPQVALEIGSGSGCALTFLASLLRAYSSSCLYLATDINPQACQATIRTGILNKVTVDALNTSFALPLSLRLQGQVDVILFNPPYVPTSSEEAIRAQRLKGIDAALSGGQDGMQVTNEFLEQVEWYLSSKGRFYLVAVKPNKIDDICLRLGERGLLGQVVLHRRAGREYLSVIRFRRNIA